MNGISATTSFHPADVQGNILRGYRHSRVRHIMLEVVEATAARHWLGAAVSGGDAPAITSQAKWDAKPDLCFNIGFTFAGLRALGVPAASLATFPDEFVQGMAARAVKLGDVGDSAPASWAEPFATPERVHLIASFHADSIEHLDRAAARVSAAGGGRAFAVLGARDGYNFDSNFVHFDYRDSISQPRFREVHESPPDGQPYSPLGAVLLGYPSECEGLLWSVPQPDVLGRNGTFNAFRVLAQDVAGFEAYLDDAATKLLADPAGEELLPPGGEARFRDLSRHAALREIVAAKMCGRWRNGVPLALSPDTPNPDPPVSLTDFDYHGGGDCPFGAHVRRVNPRGGTIVQRAARHTRRLVRRGVPYGPAWDKDHPDTLERGLLGVFIGANLGAQFEAVTCDWVNLGLQDPRITGANDPLLGANTPEASWFDIPLRSGRNIRLNGLPRFVRTRGGAYTFLPGIPAIRHIAAL